jgi:hypothetical protein
VYHQVTSPENFHKIRTDQNSEVELDSPWIQSSWPRSAPEILNSTPEQNKQLIHIKLDDLKCFETVSEQFKDLGVIFTNTIALQPSNVAYPPRSSQIVLMGMPKPGWLEIIFKYPICFFNCYVTSSQRTVLSGYDAQHNILTQTELSKANLADSDSDIPPNAQLSLSVANISRISFYAFDGQLIVNDISFKWN